MQIPESTSFSSTRNSIQKKESRADSTSLAPPIVQDALSSGGKPLDAGTRAFMEPRFNYDFGNVKIYNDSKAAKSAHSLNALAYTSGNNIVFNSGQYNTHSDSGKRLLAHELTHVVQQKGVNSKIMKQADPRTTGRTNSPACVVGPGKPNTDCGAYLSNAWWLPFAYVNNATCACMSTPNTPKYNCIRKSLQDRLAAVPTWLKIIAAMHKPNDIFGTPMYTAYQMFVQSTLTPLIYIDHVLAYNSCCCNDGPAIYPAWVGVTTVPIQPCSLVGRSIRQFGNCEGTPGVW
jgi:hypothetical protein